MDGTNKIKNKYVGKIKTYKKNRFYVSIIIDCKYYFGVNKFPDICT